MKNNQNLFPEVFANFPHVARFLEKITNNEHVARLLVLKQYANEGLIAAEAELASFPQPDVEKLLEMFPDGEGWYDVMEALSGPDGDVASFFLDLINPSDTDARPFQRIHFCLGLMSNWGYVRNMGLFDLLKGYEWDLLEQINNTLPETHNQANQEKPTLEEQQMAWMFIRNCAVAMG